MLTFELEGVVPIPLGRLWHLLWLHQDEATIREIHPWILGSRVVREAAPLLYEGRPFPPSRVVEREFRLAGRRTASTWTYAIEPPRRYGYEVALRNGTLLRFENVYEGIRGGTRVVTSGEATVRGVPGFLARWLIRRFLARADREDVAYAERVGL